MTIDRAEFDLRMFSACHRLADGQDRSRVWVEALLDAPPLTRESAMFWRHYATKLGVLDELLELFAEVDGADLISSMYSGVRFTLDKNVVGGQYDLVVSAPKTREAAILLPEKTVEGVSAKAVVGSRVSCPTIELPEWWFGPAIPAYSILGFRDLGASTLLAGISKHALAAKNSVLLKPREWVQTDRFAKLWRYYSGLLILSPVADRSYMRLLQAYLESDGPRELRVCENSPPNVDFEYWCGQCYGCFEMWHTHRALGVAPPGDLVDPTDKAAASFVRSIQRMRTERRFLYRELRDDFYYDVELETTTFIEGLDEWDLRDEDDSEA